MSVNIDMDQDVEYNGTSKKLIEHAKDLSFEYLKADWTRRGIYQNDKEINDELETTEYSSIIKANACKILATVKDISIPTSVSVFESRVSTLESSSKNYETQIRKLNIDGSRTEGTANAAQEGLEKLMLKIGEDTTETSTD